MSALFDAIFPVFAVIALGFGLRKTDFVPADHWRVVEDLCFWVFFPAILALTMMKAGLSDIQAGAFVLTLVVSVAVVCGLVLALWPVLRSIFAINSGQFTTIFQTTTRWHGFIALAVVLNLYGTAGAALIAIAFAVLVPILQIVNILVLAGFSSAGRPGPGQLLMIIVRNPIIWGVAIGLFVNLAAIPVWPPILSTLDLIGRAALGASLLALGAGLSLKAAMRPSLAVLLGVAGRALVMPAIMLAVALLLGVSGLELSVLMICAAVPTAMNGFVLARKMGGDAPLYASVATIQTIAAFAVIPAWMAIVQNWFGGA